LIGGIIDLYFIVDISADNVLKAYHNLIGIGYLPPYWSFGYHQSKSGYDSLE